MEGFGVPNFETTPKSLPCQLGSLARRGRGRRADVCLVNIHFPLSPGR